MAEKAHLTAWVAPDVLGEFRSAVAKKHGSGYKHMSHEVEEALRFWARVLTGQIKVPK